ncbi:MAG: CHASE3 domain-containing protein [Gammaproteobacteria bacterium]|nr:CHASE3 domain-containing protein [Gammaproteobacteria bacterium]
MNNEPSETLAGQTTRQSYLSHILFGVAIALILVLFISGYYLSSAVIRTLQTERDHSQRLDSVDNLLITLLDAENGVRGYLLTDNTQYLEPYAEAIKRLDGYMEAHREARQASGLLALDMTKITSLIDRNRKVYEELIENKTENRDLDKLSMYMGSLAFDEIRALLSDFKSRLKQEQSEFFRQAADRQHYVKWAVLALCIMAIGLLVWLFYTWQKQVQLRQRIAAIISDENEQLERVVSERTRQLRSLAAQLTRVSEAEKQRLARELHDDLGASLTAAKMDASWIASRSKNIQDEKLPAKVERLIDSLNQAITLKRRLTSDLLPPLLAELGLFEALRSLGEDLERDGHISVVMEIPEQQPELVHSTSLALFRIAQEATTNIRKYAEASIVTLRVAVDGNQLHLSIQDNGKGFNPDLVHEESFGLKSMRHRADMLNASFDVDTVEGGGTTISLLLHL